MVKITPEEFNADILASLDISTRELERLLQPIFHNKVKYVNGKQLKDIFKQIKDILNCHNHLRRNAYG